jgi:hypothetical protein
MLLITVLEIAFAITALALIIFTAWAFDIGFKKGEK